LQKGRGLFSFPEEIVSAYRTAYQGMPGSFSEEAARHFLGDAAALFPCFTLDEVFDALMSTHVDRIVVPVENTIAGPVPRARELMRAHEVRVVDDAMRPIVQSVVGVPGARLDDVRRVHSHPVALAQCGMFLRAHPSIEAVPSFDTAGAVAHVIAENHIEDAAIASPHAAARYGGVVLVYQAADRTDNKTRFLLLKR
jgi:prephenate dehydratase